MTTNRKEYNKKYYLDHKEKRDEYTGRYLKKKRILRRVTKIDCNVDFKKEVQHHKSKGRDIAMIAVMTGKSISLIKKYWD